MNEAAIEKLRKCRQESSVNISKDEAMAQILQNSSMMRKNPYYRGVKKIKTSTPQTPFSQRAAGEEQYLGGGNEHVAVISITTFHQRTKSHRPRNRTMARFIELRKRHKTSNFHPETHDREILIFDARPDNLIYSASGEIIPIDLQIIVKQIKK